VLFVSRNNVRNEEILEDSANLPDPDVIAAEIVDNLEAALEEFLAIYNDLEQGTFHYRSDLVCFFSTFI